MTPSDKAQERLIENDVSTMLAEVFSVKNNAGHQDVISGNLLIRTSTQDSPATPVDIDFVARHEVGHLLDDVLVSKRRLGFLREVGRFSDTVKVPLENNWEQQVRAAGITSVEIKKIRENYFHPSGAGSTEERDNLAGKASTTFVSGQRAIVDYAHDEYLATLLAQYTNPLTRHVLKEGSGHARRHRQVLSFQSSHPKAR